MLLVIRSLGKLKICNQAQMWVSVVTLETQLVLFMATQPFYYNSNYLVSSKTQKNLRPPFNLECYHFYPHHHLIITWLCVQDSKKNVCLGGRRFSEIFFLSSIKFDENQRRGRLPSQETPAPLHSSGIQLYCQVLGPC